MAENGVKEAVCNTTVCDGSTDIVGIVTAGIQSDFTAVATRYGKTAIYIAAGYAAYQIFKYWIKKRG